MKNTAWFLVKKSNNSIQYGYCERSKKSLMNTLGARGYTAKYIKASGYEIRRMRIVSPKLFISA